MLENTKGEIQDDENKTTTQYANTNRNHVNKSWSLLQTTGGQDEPNIVFLYGNRNGHHHTELRL